MKLDLTYLKQAAERATPYVSNETGQACLEGLLKANPELYDRCLETVGFAFYFNQIVNRAIRYDAVPEEQVLELIRQHGALREALEKVAESTHKITDEQSGRVIFDGRCGVSDIARKALEDV